MHGVESVEIGDCGADGAMGTSLAAIKAIAKDTVIFEIAEPDITEIEIENTDEPDILDIEKSGIKSLSFETRDLSLDNFVTYFGGSTTTGPPEVYDAPVRTTKILQSVKLTSRYVDGNRIVISIPKAFVYASLSGEAQNSETGRIVVTARVMTPFDATDTALAPFTVQYESVG